MLVGKIDAVEVLLPIACSFFLFIMLAYFVASLMRRLFRRSSPSASDFGTFSVSRRLAGACLKRVLHANRGFPGQKTVDDTVGRSFAVHWAKAAAARRGNFASASSTRVPIPDDDEWFCVDLKSHPPIVISTPQSASEASKPEGLVESKLSKRSSENVFGAQFLLSEIEQIATKKTSTSELADSIESSSTRADDNAAGAAAQAAAILTKAFEAPKTSESPQQQVLGLMRSRSALGLLPAANVVEPVDAPQKPVRQRSCALPAPDFVFMGSLPNSDGFCTVCLDDELAVQKFACQDCLEGQRLTINGPTMATPNSSRSIQGIVSG